MALHTFLRDLAVVLGAAAITTVVCQRLRQPVVLGYLIAGLVVGPYLPIPLAADPETIHTLSELGVILLMFSLGLEFSLRKLLRLGGTAGLVATIEMGLLFFLGYLAGRLLGWGPRGSLFSGATVAISSTMIVARSLASAPRGFKEQIFGVLIFEDLGAILMMAGLATLAAPGGEGSVSLGTTALRLLGYLIGSVVLGLLLVPRLIRATVSLHSAETLLVVSVGLCFVSAVLAQHLGYSVALGAFLAGLLVAESGESHRIEVLVQPLRDLFAAIFFVSVGMLIEPRALWQHRGAIALLSAVVVLGKITGVSLGAFLSGSGVRASLQAGFTLAQIGEFSFIIAGLGRDQGTAVPALYPVAVAVSVVTTALSPLLLRVSGPVAAFIDRRLPQPVQTFVTLYGTWIEQLRSAKGPRPSRQRRVVRLLLMDNVCILLIIIGAALGLPWVQRLLGRLGLSPGQAQITLMMVATLLCTPFMIGVVRCLRSLGTQLAAQAIPEVPPGTLDLGRAPRQVLNLAMQVLLVLLMGVPLLALTQPFLGAWPMVLVLGLVLGVLGTALGRRTADLHGHVRAGTELLLEVLTITAPPSKEGAPSEPPPPPLLPGGTAYVTVHLPAGSTAVGSSLAQLNLRGLSGATVLALHREGQRPVPPRAKEPLLAGDALVLIGTEEALAAARQILGAP